MNLNGWIDCNYEDIPYDLSKVESIWSSHLGHIIIRQDYTPAQQDTLNYYLSQATHWKPNPKPVKNKKNGSKRKTDC